MTFCDNYTSPSLLFLPQLFYFSSSMLLYNSCTTYCTIVSFVRTPAPYSPLFLFLYNCTPGTLQRSPSSLSSSTLPCTLLLLLEAALLLHYALSPFSIRHAVVLFLLPFFFSFLDISTFYVSFLCIWSIVASLPLLLASSLPSIHTTLLYSSILQIYSPPLSCRTINFSNISDIWNLIIILNSS